jgi:cyanophycin synthetase
LQTLAGMDMGFGRTRTTGKDGEYYVVFDYMEEEAGVYAAKAAFNLVKSLVDDSEYNLDADVQKLREIREQTRWLGYYY